MAKRRSSGTGLVITLIVFILLAITGLGLSVHLYQQLGLAEEAISSNQRAFSNHIKAVFDRAGWELPERIRDDYGIVYDGDTYIAVAEKLAAAEEFEAMQPMLPWVNASEVETAMAAFRPDEEDFNQVEGLLRYYSGQYNTLRERVEDLNRRNRDFVSQLEEKDERFEQMRAEVNRQFRTLESNYAERLAELRGQYSAMERRWRLAREETGGSFQQLREAVEEMEDFVEEKEKLLAEEQQRVQELLEKLAVPEEVEVWKPAGEVFAVERDSDIIIVEGGTEAGHRRNDQIVIYRTDHNGEPVYVASAVISRVHEVSSMATVIERKHPILEGHLFVKRSTWEEADFAETADRSGMTPDRAAPRLDQTDGDDYFIF